MVAVFDAVGPSSAGATGGNVTTLSWAHTVGSGNNRLLIAGIGVGGTSVNTKTATVTWTATGQTAQNMTSAGRVANGSGATTGFTEMFVLIAPTSGAGTVTMTLSALPATNAGLEGGSVSFADADQTTGIGTAVTAAPASTGSAVSATVTGTTSGNPVIDVISQGSGSAATVGAGQTTQWQRITNSFSRAGGAACSIETSAGGSVAMTWTLTAADGWGSVAAEVLPAAPSGPEPGRFLLAG